MAKCHLLFYFLFLPNCIAAEVLLSEVAPSIPNGDFIEIFTSQKSNLNQWVLLEGTKVIKKFPNVTLNSGPFGSYLILHASEKVSDNNMDESDLTGDINHNGMIDLYSDESSPGITGGASNNITLKTDNGKIVDFLSWSLPGDPYSTPLQSPYVQASTHSIWSPICELGQVSCIEAGSISWNNKSSLSLQRRIGPKGMPVVHSPTTAEDWQLGTPTHGAGYYKSVEPKDSLLEIFQSPFSPSDGPHREALISFKVQADSRVTLSLYHLQGTLLRSLLESIPIPTSEIQIISWDGKDSNGEILPVGIYCVQIEVVQPDGLREKEVKTVIIAQQL